MIEHTPCSSAGFKTIVNCSILKRIIAYSVLMYTLHYSPEGRTSPIPTRSSRSKPWLKKWNTWIYNLHRISSHGVFRCVQCQCSPVKICKNAVKHPVWSSHNYAVQKTSASMAKAPWFELRAENPVSFQGDRWEWACLAILTELKSSRSKSDHLELWLSLHWHKTS